MRALFITHKEAMLPFFEQLLPHFVKLLVSEAYSTRLLTLASQPVHMAAVN